MEFEFATATRIVFGAGSLARAGGLAAERGRRALLVTGRSLDRAKPLLDELAARGVGMVHYCVVQEPDIETTTRGVALARRENCDVVIGLGGGSVIDAGKAIAALSNNAGEPLDYLEVIGRGQPLRDPSAPYIAIPTTAGTGAEVTCNAVLSSPEHGVKVSLRSPVMLPCVAIVDPELTYGLPPALTASTGLDALTQVMEPFVSKHANPLTDAICREGICRAARSLRQAHADGRDVVAREDMALVSLFGGLALANAKLGAVHGFAGPFGGMFPAPHGATCAALLPHVMAVNVQTLRRRDPDNAALKRYDTVAQLLIGESAATAEDGVAWVQDLCRVFAVPTLAHYGLAPSDVPALIQKASRASSMKGNPIQLTEAELSEIIGRAI